MKNLGTRFGALVCVAAVAAGCARVNDVDAQGVARGVETFVVERDRRPDLMPVIPDTFQPAEVGTWPGAPDWVTPPEPDPDPKPGVWKPKDCPEIFGEALQTFEVELDPAVWEDIQDEYENGDDLDEDEVELYHPLIRFTHGGESTTDAMIRLRGNVMYWDKQDKMQFQISFNETNKDGRFRGLRKIVLDSAHYNESYLRDRLAMGIARDAGIIAPCVNHARLIINGEFYGLYAHIEKIDREFLERNFEDPGANLYKMTRKTRGELKTNEDENPDTSRMEDFWDADRVVKFDKLANLPQFVRAWAAEAIFPDTDGYWAGGWNFYLYDDPREGFAYILWDVDQAFERVPPDLDPVTWHKTNENFNGRPHVEMILADPKWRWEFIREIRHVRDAMDVNVLQARIDTWAEQIRDSAREDRHAPWKFGEHVRIVKDLREYVEDRLEFIDEWLECWEAHDGEQDFYGPCPD